MRQQMVIIGELVINREPLLNFEWNCLRAKQTRRLPHSNTGSLDTRFLAGDPEKRKHPGLTVEEVARLLHCRCRSVLRMIRRGDLHPFTGEDGELYFDRVEVEIITHVPLNDILSRRI
jgi:hypothetical protein